MVDRPVAKVYHSQSHKHLRNHPCWVPDMELSGVSDGPIGVGIVFPICLGLPPNPQQIRGGRATSR